MDFIDFGYDLCDFGSDFCDLGWECCDFGSDVCVFGLEFNDSDVIIVGFMSDVNDPGSDLCDCWVGL